ncbi:TetR/AcrR family transcriptional regulator [Ruegeria sp. 2012CJ41-6]|uniref:TetR/AcrR family transcriptional regulator n=1 Tax=Ruegeria spongiae TaxID=2942209 RepID=A0ABT0PX57_9RHOB|nr:TetR/AcrR family transcriptional regulator [Ruegeria spongiae]MCL6282190.1 TetR/AcrR family transcriptional regulator [Ruegeria spongiae]
MAETSAASSWREPTQPRSRKRVRAILDATEKLLIESDVATVKMTEVARVAGVPVGSVYQYFPTRTALLTKLFEDQVAGIDSTLKAGLSQLTNWDQLEGFVVAASATAHDLVQQSPCLQKIWNSTGVDPAIEIADQRTTLHNARILTETLLRIAPHPISETLAFASAILFFQTWSTMMKLLPNIEDEHLRDAIREQHVAMVLNHLKAAFDR